MFCHDPFLAALELCNSIDQNRLHGQESVRKETIVKEVSENKPSLQVSRPTSISWVQTVVRNTLTIVGSRQVMFYCCL